MKLRIKERAFFLENFRSTRLKSGQAYLKDQVGRCRAVDKLVASPGLYGGIEFVIKPIWPAGVRS
jgi:hypothetical protein